jgi:L-seryl-tRNA(Ser) seleniumtransferase
VVAQAGATLVEVGTTNRTRLDDYRAAVAAGADLVLRVHQSNFRTLGYVAEPDIEALCDLDVPVVDDVGSGAFADQLPVLADEPPVPRSVHAGAAAVCFSGDKLLGGPQAGIVVGTRAAVDACRKHPLARALRIGRLPLAGLAATLGLYRDPARALREIPVLAMLNVEPAVLRTRAAWLAHETGGEIIDAVARVGGGALPILELRGPVVALGEPSIATGDGSDPSQLAAALRAGDPPLVTRISQGRVVIDPRTLHGEDLDAAAAAVRRVQASCGRSQSQPD